MLREALVVIVVVFVVVFLSILQYTSTKLVSGFDLGGGGTQGKLPS